MWIKLFLLLVYICLLFLLSRLLETISWCDLGPSRVLSRQFLDPMRLSVAKLKCLLDHRGVSYDGIVEKSELTSLVKASGSVNEADIDMSCQEESEMNQTNFTSGAHFIEQVEDAKDSVWLVQVVTQKEQAQVVMNRRWRNIQRKVSHFGVRTGLLDCSLDARYCYSKGWKMPVMLLALPRVFEKKANVIMYNYSGPATESAVMRWLHDKLESKVVQVTNVSSIREQHSPQKTLQPEIHAILFTQVISAPLFFSALSVKFPGRVKFGMVTVDNDDDNGNNNKSKNNNKNSDNNNNSSNNDNNNNNNDNNKNNESKPKKTLLKRLTERYNISHLPMIIIYTAEGNYTYGLRPSEKFSFSNMEIFLKFLYPCLNDIFIISFCVANVMSWLELFVSNCGLGKRIRNFVWCFLKYNIMVIMLWLPVIGVFQMPYLDQVPLLLLKLHRIFTTSDAGAILRGDYIFFVNNPIYVYLSFVGYLIVVTLLCKKYRQVEDDSEDWFNFRQMQTLTHIGANNLFEPMRVSSYDLVGGFEVFGSRFSQPSLWLQPSIPLEYIQHLPTWRFTPQSMASRAAQNAVRVQSSMVSAASESSPPWPAETKSVLKCCHDKEHGRVCTECNSCCCNQCSPISTSNTTTVLTPAHDSPTSLTVTECRCPTSSPMSKPCFSHSHQKHECCFKSHTASSTCCENPTHKIRMTGSCSSTFAGESSTNFKGSSDHLKNLQKPNCSCHQTQTHPPVNSSSSSSSSSSLSSVTPPPQPVPSPPPPPTPTPNHHNAQHQQSDILPSGFRRGFMESHQCVICLDDYAPLTMLCGLPCGHVFHETCIISWLNREKHFCPMCRWPSYKLYVSPNPS